MLAASLLRCVSRPPPAPPRALSLFLSPSVCHPAQCWRQLLRIFLLSPPLSLSPIPGAAKCLQHVSRGQQALQGLCEFFFCPPLIRPPLLRPQPQALKPQSIYPPAPRRIPSQKLFKTTNNNHKKTIINKKCSRLEVQKAVARGKLNGKGFT